MKIVFSDNAWDDYQHWVNNDGGNLVRVNSLIEQCRRTPFEGTGKPEYGKCVEISTKAALREMMLPGILTIGLPIAIVLLGKLVYPSDNQLIAEMLGGYMAGVTVSGVLWAVFQNNAGGAWDNAKKSFEAGVEINGEMTYKGSDAHKAAVTGDTVGDPFKDTAGPALNPLIKVMNLVALLILPAIIKYQDNDGVRFAISGISLAILVAAISFSRRQTESMVAA